MQSVFVVNPQLDIPIYRQLVDATRRSEAFLRGGSPRATLAVTAMAKAVARLRGRGYVIPQDTVAISEIVVLGK